ncbi:DNA-J related domain-containing protein [Vibrio barjaei]|uniref:DNA-J related domain-containing protein n=1 Tax=Vibrio barjaei TaxID=1676683 RepID=UPI00228345DE|nr:DNA-J related domain-containing protein [Vibrio barjaei]MCY9871822.1 DnaJ domain-containing protein [Vibrio barjaei]
MTGYKDCQVQSHRQADNPLLWSVLHLIENNVDGLKIHTLASQLADAGLIPSLDESPEKDLFKRNFLLMNALYQLQELLIPEKWLQVEAMDIQLFSYRSAEHAIDKNNPLREYYLDWSHYEADTGEVKRLLEDFWQRYKHFVGVSSVTMSRSVALKCFELNEWATQKEIRQAWRKLALKWHPDREGGDAEKFRRYCEAWSLLKE